MDQYGINREGMYTRGMSSPWWSVEAIFSLSYCGSTVDQYGINRGVCIRVECPFRGGSVEAIFGLSYGPGTMKFVISDSKNL